MTFEKALEELKFNEALKIFEQMHRDDKEQILKQLYYQARNAKQPVAVSVLRRQLHTGKTFDDFSNAWMPPKDSMNPFTVGSATYYQHFETPVRVINAINMNDSNDILSIGLVWCTEEEFKLGIKKAQENKSNTARGDNIKEVADKKSIELFLVKTDTNLGT